MLREETVTHILNIERDALNTYENAQFEARQLVEEAKKAADMMRKQALAEVHQQAKQILADGRKTAELKRADIIAHAGAEAQNLETVGMRHFDEAVRFILDKVVGLE
jgi:vacuolar-type H+-ATPase subunit H